MLYEFVGYKCPNAPEEKGRCVACVHELSFPMGKAPSSGEEVACPVVGCRAPLTRVFSRVNVIVAGDNLYNWKPGESMRYNVNGQDMRFTFVDHPDVAEENRRAHLANIASTDGRTAKSYGNGLGKAYYSEKHGRVCVDVISNAKDPLGTLERSRAKGDVVTEVKTHKVNTPVKVRSKKGK